MALRARGASCAVPTGGYLARSLAIMTDAAHLLTDVGSMSVSLFSLWVSNRPPTKTMTFGWHRSGELRGTALRGSTGPPWPGWVLTVSPHRDTRCAGLCPVYLGGDCSPCLSGGRPHHQQRLRDRGASHAGHIRLCRRRQSGVCRTWGSISLSPLPGTPRTPATPHFMSLCTSFVSTATASPASLSPTCSVLPIRVPTSPHSLFPAPPSSASQALS